MNFKAAAGLAILILAGAAWGALKHWQRPSDPLLTFANTTGGILLASEGKIKQPGSMAVVARAPVVFRVYMIDKGEQTLKETIRFDPKDEPAIYFTASVSSQEGSALVIHDHPTGQRKQIYRAISFPMPVSMVSAPCYGKIDPYGGVKAGQENLCFEFILGWTDRGSPLVGSIDDMKKQSKTLEARCSYLAVTCEKM